MGHFMEKFNGLFNIKNAPEMANKKSVKTALFALEIKPVNCSHTKTNGMSNDSC
jgi:hypothetical protein